MARLSPCIDLTFDDIEDIPGASSASKSEIIILDDDSDDDNKRQAIIFRQSTRKRQRKAEFSDDEIVVLSSSPPVASSSKLKKPKKNDSDDEEDLGGFANAFSEEDERLARRLAQEEEESFQALMDNIDSKEDGIVFSVVVNVENNTLEDGSPAHPDDLDRFAPWKALCEKSGQKVKKFHWFVNYELEKRFDQARDKLAAIMGKYPPEVQLFHGTSAMNIDSILKGGFKIGGVNGHPISHGTSMGFGTYLATDAATSLSYNPQKIFACRVVPGRTTNTPIMQPPPSIHVGAERYDSYHTPGVYVHRYPSLILPCYMIEFEAPNYNNYWAGAGGLAAFGGIGGIPGLGGAGLPGLAMGGGVGVGAFGLGGLPGMAMGALAPPAPPARARKPRAPRKVKNETNDSAGPSRKRTQVKKEDDSAPLKKARTPPRKGKSKAKAEDDDFGFDFM